MKSVRMCFFSLLILFLAISGAALQEEKLVGICAPLLPSPGLYQYAGPVTSIKGLCCLCTVKVTAAPCSAVRSAPQRVQSVPASPWHRLLPCHAGGATVPGRLCHHALVAF